MCIVHNVNVCAMMQVFTKTILSQHITSRTEYKTKEALRIYDIPNNLNDVCYLPNVYRNLLRQEEGEASRKKRKKYPSALTLWRPLLSFQGSCEEVMLFRC